MKKILITFAIFLVLAITASALTRREDITTSRGMGNAMFALPNATITVYNSDRTTLATLATDSIGTPLSNPITSDSAGRYFYYVPNGIYNEYITKPGHVPQWRYDISFTGTLALVASFNTRTGDVTLTSADVATAYTGSTSLVAGGSMSVTSLQTAGTITGNGSGLTNIPYSSTSGTATYATSAGTASTFRTFSTTTSGIVPASNATYSTTTYLRADGTWTTDLPSNIRIVQPPSGLTGISLSSSVVSTVTVGTKPHGAAYSPSNDRVYVANNYDSTVSVIRPSDNTVVATVAVGTNPVSVSYSPSNDRVYVANYNSGNVSVIRPSDNTVVATVTVGTNPYGAAYSPSNDRVYVVNNGSGNVSVIRPSDNTVVATVTVGTSPNDVSYSPSNDRVYVVNYFSGNVSVIRPSDNTVVATVVVGTGPNYVAYSPSNDRVYVVNNGSGNVSVIRPSDNTVVATVTVGASPNNVAYSPSNDRVYVVNTDDSTVSVIRPSDNTVVATVTVGVSPNSVVYSPSNDRLYVANYGSNNVSVVYPSITPSPTTLAGFGITNALSTDYTGSTSLVTGGTMSVTSLQTAGTVTAGAFAGPLTGNVIGNVSGSAATWTTARNLAGNSVDGSANVAFSNKFIVQGTSDAGLSSAQFLGSLGTGIVKNTTTTGVLSIATGQNDFTGLTTTDHPAFATVDLSSANGGFRVMQTPSGLTGLNLSSAVVSTVTVSTGPRNVAYSPSNDRIYVANYSSNNVSVIRPSDNTVVSTVTVSTGPIGIAYSPSNDRIYVANYGGNNVSVIRPSDNTVVSTVTVSTGPQGIAYSPSNDRIYVANNGDNNVSVIRPSDNTVVSTVTVSTGPFGIAYSPSNDRIYVVNYSSNNVSVIRPSDNTVVSTVTVGTNPRNVAYSPSNDRIYVVNYSSNNVSVIYPSITPSPTTLAGFGITDAFSNVLSGTTTTIGGSLLVTAGTCTTATATVSGATTAMVAIANPSDGVHEGLVSVYTYVSAANTVSVDECALAAVTPAARQYYVRVIK